jgi:hypothetical protein
LWTQHKDHLKPTLYNHKKPTTTNLNLIIIIFKFTWEKVHILNITILRAAFITYCALISENHRQNAPTIWFAFIENKNTISMNTNSNKIQLHLSIGISIHYKYFKYQLLCFAYRKVRYPVSTTTTIFLKKNLS